MQRSNAALLHSIANATEGAYDPMEQVNIYNFYRSHLQPLYSLLYSEWGMLNIFHRGALQKFNEKHCNTGNFEITFCSEVSCDAKCGRIKV